MEMWKCEVKVFGKVSSFVSVKGCVREWLCWVLGKGGVECGFVWKKEVNCVENCENFEYCDIEWMFYEGKDGKLVWENWGGNRRVRERELFLF